MKTFVSMILAFAVFIGTAWAGPVKTAGNVAKSTVRTTKNVGYSVLKGTGRVLHTVVHTLAR